LLALRKGLGCSCIRSYELPESVKSAATAPKPLSLKPVSYAWQALVRDISGLGDRSAYGLPNETGVLLVNVPASSLAAKARLQKDDVIVACHDKPVRTVADLLQHRDEAAGKPLSITIISNQNQMTVII
jgi:S1-C subfamily serine protease